jgi:hypothetical protein
MSVTNPSIATASRERADKASTGISSGKPIRARTPDTPPQARLASVRTVARLSQFHKRHPYRLSAGVSEMR